LIFAAIDNISKRLIAFEGGLATNPSGSFSDPNQVLIYEIGTYILNSPNLAIFTENRNESTSFQE
jgi:hypothetical protein